ncbi:MAG TPA: rhodanese-like domain-containing protein [Acidimicrobiales bacterium]|nr:rhodanese-like domain-containing protein [Acidimicrobiales bacterium]
MDVNTLEQRFDDVQVVDVRQRREWEAGHIESARHVPADTLSDHLEELDRSRPVVTVCRSGSRSANVARALAGEGFEAQSLEGGLLAWEEAGLALVDSDGGPGHVDDDDGHQRLQADFLSLSREVQEHFGDHEPSEEEIRAYLRQRLIGEGHSPAEADEVMARITSEPYGSGPGAGGDGGSIPAG